MRIQKLRFLLLVLALALTLALTAPAAIGESVPNPAGLLIGVWEVDWEATAAAGGDIYFDEGEAFALTMAFDWDGAFVQMVEDEVFVSGEYTVSGDTLILDTEYDSEIVSFTVAGDVLTIAGDNEGEIIVFYRAQ